MQQKLNFFLSMIYWGLLSKNYLLVVGLFFYNFIITVGKQICVDFVLSVACVSASASTAAFLFDCDTC